MNQKDRSHRMPRSKFFLSIWIWAAAGFGIGFGFGLVSLRGYYVSPAGSWPPRHTEAKAAIEIYYFGGRFYQDLAVIDENKLYGSVDDYLLFFRSAFGILGLAITLAIRLILQRVVIPIITWIRRSGRPKKES